MSSIEERLAKMDHMITVWEGREISPNQKYTVDGCEAYDLALQLAGLLRDHPDPETWIEGYNSAGYRLSMNAWIKRCDALLDGEGGGDERG